MKERCIQVKNLTKALLHSFGLSDLKKSYVSKLSGGEKQKLSVVLALIGDPEIVFLDELTTGLDVLLLVIAVICTAVSVITFRWE